MKPIKQTMILLILLITNSLYADFIDIQKEVYEPVEEMRQMDEAMNRAIEKRRQENQLLTKQQQEIEEQKPMPTFILEENQYVLIKEIDNAEKTKVDVKLDQELLHISTVTTITKKMVTESGTHDSSFESTTEETLSIPHDADSSTLQSDYSNGQLRVTLMKRKVASYPSR